MAMEIESLPPPIAAQVKYLLAHNSFPVEIDQIWSGCNHGKYSDRLSLVIPFCLDYVKWEIIYNGFYPDAAPDIVFPPEDEDFHPLLFNNDDGVVVNESSLYNWDVKDPSRLLKLVHEIRNMYIHHQEKKVGEVDDARLKFEMNTVLSREGIEVCKISAHERAEVKFAVPLLDMDLNKLVPCCPWTKQQKIHLQAVFPVARNHSSTASPPQIKLVSSPDLKMFFSVDDIKLPSWVDGMCMAEYLPSLEETLLKEILEAVKGIDARRHFIEALAPVFGRPLEADPVFCRNASILASSGAFVFLVHFSIPPQFPKHQPILTLESSVHFDLQGRPIRSGLMMEYPWSPRWETNHMIERISDFLSEECLRFKNYCTEASARQ